jgi:hypothetical protein
MTDALLMLVVIGTVLVAFITDAMALATWLRRRWR